MVNPTFTDIRDYAEFVRINSDIPVRVQVVQSETATTTGFAEGLGTVFSGVDAGIQIDTGVALVVNRNIPHLQYFQDTFAAVGNGWSSDAAAISSGVFNLDNDAATTIPQTTTRTFPDVGDTEALSSSKDWQIVLDLQTGTIIDANVAASVTSKAGPFTVVGGDTLLLTVNGGDTRTITFATGDFATPGVVTAEEIAQKINSELAFLGATVYLNTADSTKFDIISNTKGASSSVVVAGGTADSKLFSPASPSDTGADGDGFRTKIVLDLTAESDAAIPDSFSGLPKVVEFHLFKDMLRAFESNGVGGTTAVDVPFSNFKELNSILTGNLQLFVRYDAVASRAYFSLFGDQAFTELEDLTPNGILIDEDGTGVGSASTLTMSAGAADGPDTVAVQVDAFTYRQFDFNIDDDELLSLFTSTSIPTLNFTGATDQGQRVSVNNPSAPENLAMATHLSITQNQLVFEQQFDTREELLNYINQNNNAIGLVTFDYTDSRGELFDIGFDIYSGGPNTYSNVVALRVNQIIPKLDTRKKVEAESLSAQANGTSDSFVLSANPLFFEDIAYVDIDGLAASTYDFVQQPSSKAGEVRIEVSRLEALSGDVSFKVNALNQDGKPITSDTVTVSAGDGDFTQTLVTFTPASERVVRITGISNFAATDPADVGSRVLIRSAYVTNIELNGTIQANYSRTNPLVGVLELLSIPTLNAIFPVDYSFFIPNPNYPIKSISSTQSQIHNIRTDSEGNIVLRQIDPAELRMTLYGLSATTGNTPVAARVTEDGFLRVTMESGSVAITGVVRIGDSEGGLIRWISDGDEVSSTDTGVVMVGAVGDSAGSDTHQFVRVDGDGHLQVDVLSGGGGGTLVTDGTSHKDSNVAGILVGATGDSSGSDTYKLVNVDADGHLQVDILSGAGGGTLVTDGQDYRDSHTGAPLVGVTGDSSGSDIYQFVKVDSSGQLLVSVVNQDAPVEVSGTASVEGTVSVSGPVEISGVTDVSGTVDIGSPVEISGAVDTSITNQVEVSVANQIDVSIVNAVSIDGTVTDGDDASGANIGLPIVGVSDVTGSSDVYHYLSVDEGGRLQVDVVEGIGTINVSTINLTEPMQMAGRTDISSAATETPVLVDASGHLKVDVLSQPTVNVSVANTVEISETLGIAGYTNISSLETETPILVNASGHLQVDIQNQTAVGHGDSATNAETAEALIVAGATGSGAGDSYRYLNVDASGHLQADVLSAPETAVSVQNLVDVGAIVTSGTITLASGDTEQLRMQPDGRLLVTGAVGLIGEEDGSSTDATATGLPVMGVTGSGGSGDTYKFLNVDTAGHLQIDVLSQPEISVNVVSAVESSVIVTNTVPVTGSVSVANPASLSVHNAGAAFSVTNPVALSMTNAVALSVGALVTSGTPTLSSGSVATLRMQTDGKLLVTGAVGLIGVEASNLVASGDTGLAMIGIEFSDSSPGASGHYRYLNVDEGGRLQIDVLSQPESSVIVTNTVPVTGNVSVTNPVALSVANAGAAFSVTGTVVVAGSDGPKGPAKAILVDSEGHVKVDVLSTAGTTSVANAGAAFSVTNLVAMSVTGTISHSEDASGTNIGVAMVGVESIAGSSNVFKYLNVDSSGHLAVAQAGDWAVTAEISGPVRTVPHFPHGTHQDPAVSQ